METKNDVRIPDVEVLIQAAQSDVALLCFFMGRSPHDPVEVVSSIRDIDEVGIVVSLLQDCIKALSAKNWVSLDELDSYSGKDEGSFPPF